MGKIITLHSYRGGTGKSNIAANLAYLIAKRGHSVAVLDTDIQSPGVHLIYGMDQGRVTFTLSDFVLGKCELEETAYDISDELDLGASGGQLRVLPSRMSVEDISRVLADGYDANKLNSEFNKLLTELELDFLFLDTHPGLNKETLLTTSISDSLILLVRPDKQDYHGTALLVEVARRLQVPRVSMLLNKVLSTMDKEAIRAKVEAAYECPVIGILSFEEDVMSNGSHSLFTKQFPSHSWTAELNRIADSLLALNSETA